MEPELVRSEVARGRARGAQVDIDRSVRVVFSVFCGRTSRTIIPMGVLFRLVWLEMDGFHWFRVSCCICQGQLPFQKDTYDPYQKLGVDQ